MFKSSDQCIEGGVLLQAFVLQDVTEQKVGGDYLGGSAVTVMDSELLDAASLVPCFKVESFVGFIRKSG